MLVWYTYRVACKSEAGSRLHSEVLRRGCEGWRRWEVGHLLLDGDRVAIEGVGKGRLVVECGHVLSLDALRIVQEGDQVLDVGASQTERVDLGELPIGGISGH